MANTYGKPWILDTASTSNFIHPFGNTIGAVASIYVRGAMLVGYGSASDKAIFKDAAGNVVIELDGGSSLGPSGYYRGNGLGFIGLKLAQLDSGKVVMDVL